MVCALLVIIAKKEISFLLLANMVIIILIPAYLNVLFALEVSTVMAKVYRHQLEIVVKVIYVNKDSKVVTLSRCYVMDNILLL